jgi:homocysteine S-methyltransferase
MPDILEHLGEGTLRADTAISALLPPTARCPEELNLTHPDLVRQAHVDAIAAGARLIRTNSYAANAPTLTALGLADRANEIAWSAAQLARQAAIGTDTFIAGRVGPLPPSTPPADRRAIFQKQIGALLDSKVDLICLEGFTDLADLALAIEIKHELHHLPVLASFIPTGHQDLKILTAAEPDLLALDSLDLATTLAHLAQLPTNLPLAIFPTKTAPNSPHYQLAGINP